MGILIRNEDTCLVHCFTCHFKAGSIVKLFATLAEFDPRWGEFLEEAKKIEEVDVALMLDAMSGYDGWADQKKTSGQIFPEEQYAPYGGKYHKYLKRRGITLEAAKIWESGWDRKRKRVLFPVRNYRGSLVGAVGRTIHRFSQIKYLNYWDFKKGKVLFGEHLASGGKGVVLVEGLLDAVVVWQNLGPMREEYDVVSTLGSYLSEIQLEKLVRFWGQVVILYDNNSAGREGADYAVRRLHRRTHIRKAEYVGGDPDDGGYEDPAELPVDLLQKMIDEAPLAWGE